MYIHDTDGKMFCIIAFVLFVFFFFFDTIDKLLEFEKNFIN